MTTRYRFSARSLRNLEGVDQTLVDVMTLALTKHAVYDFGVSEGLRTAERQRQLLAAGASQVSVSRHQTGHAVDVMVYVAGRVSWELPLYCETALAVRKAAIELGIKVRWGGCWVLVQSLPDTALGIERAVREYSDRRRAQGRRPLIDGPHFEIPA